MESDLPSSKSPYKKVLDGDYNFIQITANTFLLPKICMYAYLFSGINNTLMNLTRSIVNMKYDIKNMTTKMDRVENIMSDLQKNSNKSFSKGNNNPVDTHIYNFPITSYDELKVFEEKLLDIEFRQKVVNTVIHVHVCPK